MLFRMTEAGSVDSDPYLHSTQKDYQPFPGVRLAEERKRANELTARQGLITGPAIISGDD